MIENYCDLERRKKIGFIIGFAKTSHTHFLKLLSLIFPVSFTRFENVWKRGLDKRVMMSHLKLIKNKFCFQN